jgi:hypothetical protein
MEAETASTGIVFRSQHIPGTFRLLDLICQLDFERGGLLRAVRSGCFSAMQKRGVPRLHGNMLPGNSFPQICVVSGSMIDGVQSFAQEYFCAMTHSNILLTDE